MKEHEIEHRQNRRHLENLAASSKQHQPLALATYCRIFQGDISKMSLLAIIVHKL